MEFSDKSDIKEKFSLLPTDTLVDLELITPISSKRVKTEFIGTVSDQFVLVKAPEGDKNILETEDLKDNVTLVFRALLERASGEIIAFRTRVRSSSTYPVPLLFIDYPEQVQSLPLRVQPRLQTLIPAQLKIADLCLDGVITNISATGAQFEFQEEGKFSQYRGEDCALIIADPNLEGSKFNGSISNLKINTVNMQFGINLSQEGQKIAKYVKDHLFDLSVL